MSGRCTFPARGNPAGIEPKSEPATPCRSRPMRPSRTVSCIAVFCVHLCVVRVLHRRTILGHADNYIPANPGRDARSTSCRNGTICRSTRSCASIPEQACWASMALFGSILILAFLPWLDTSRVQARRNYRPLYRQFFWLFFAVCIGLGWLGSKPARRHLHRDRVAHPDHRTTSLHFIIVLAAARIDRAAFAAAQFDHRGGPG